MIRFKKVVVSVLLLGLLIGSFLNFNIVEANQSNNLSPSLEGIDYWYLDDENNYIYLFYENKITFLNLDDLSKMDELTIEDINFYLDLMDYETLDGNLYLLDAYNNIYIINIQTKNIDKIITLDTIEFVWDIAVDDGKIYYSLAENNNIYYYDLELEKSFSIDTNKTYYYPVLATDADNNILYVGETTETSSTVEAIKTSDHTFIDKSAHIDNNDTYYYTILVDNGDVFYGGNRIDGNELSIVNGNYGGEVWYVSDNYVITENGLYERDTFKAIDDNLQYNILIDNNDNVYFYNVNGQIERMNINEIIGEIPSNDGINNEEYLNYIPTDIEETHWAYDYMLDFLTADLLTGYIDSEGNVELKPDIQITRAEFITIVIRALGLTDDTGAKDFKDVNSDEWYYSYINIASANNIVNGINDDEFAPNKQIQRDEITAIIVRAFESSVDFENGEPKNFTDVEDYWATQYIDKASSVGIVNGRTDDLFNPSANATRAEAVTMLYRTINLEENLLADDNQLIETVTNFYTKVDEASNLYQFSQYEIILDKYTMGYFNAHQDLNLEIIKSLYDMGVETYTELKGQPTFTVTHKSNSFAIVEVQGLVYDNSYSFNGETEIETQNLSGNYYLKKTTDGEWKIYNAEFPYLLEQ